LQNDSSDLGTRIEELTRRLGEVERRLAVLERPAATAPRGPAPYETEVEQERAIGAEKSGFSEGLPLYGRTLMVLGGGFALRAITEGELVSRVVGTALGIAYALLWIFLVDRDAVRGRHSSAMFHGLAATGIAFPLLWEATVKFEILSPLAGAAALAAVTGLALTVVVRRRLRGLAWWVSLGAAITTLALAVSTTSWSLFVFELLLLAFVAMWLGYERGWQALAWTVSVLVAGTILLMTVMLLVASEEQVWRLFSPDMLLAIQLSWVVVFFGTLGYRKLTTSEDLTAGEILLGLATLGVGFGGATAVTHSTRVSGASLAVVSLALAAGCYGFAFVFADRETEHRRSFIFYSTFALLVTLIASGAMLQGTALALTFAFAALVTTWLGAWKERATLSLHGAVYVIGAALACGLMTNGAAAFAAVSVPSVSWITPYVLIVLAVAGVFAWLPVATHGRTWGRFSAAPKVAIIAVLVFGVGAIAVTLGGRGLSVANEGTGDPAMLASLRTGVLAAAAVMLAWSGRSPRWPEALWLVYPTLAVGALKLLLDDLRKGRPATLFISFVLYGIALILAPRLARRGR
jgi:hypothetical protein